MAEEDDEVAEDFAYETAFDSAGMASPEAAILAHAMSTFEDDQNAAAPEPDQTLEHERALAVKKSQDSVRPRSPSPMEN